jgi:hypothetical protein
MSDENDSREKRRRGVPGRMGKHIVDGHNWDGQLDRLFPIVSRTIQHVPKTFPLFLLALNERPYIGSHLPPYTLFSERAL